MIRYFAREKGPLFIVQSCAFFFTQGKHTDDKSVDFINISCPI